MSSVNIIKIKVCVSAIYIPVLTFSLLLRTFDFTTFISLCTDIATPTSLFATITSILPSSQTQANCKAKISFNWKMVSHLALCVLLVVSTHMTYVSGECCYDSNGVCADGTYSTPCCGHGPCNIFCCNCDGGCRRFGTGGRLSPNQTNEPLFDGPTCRDVNGIEGENEQDVEISGHGLRNTADSFLFAGNDRAFDSY
ncbi:unnamed protein product [Allacma fusca]|uniref:Uncharacterized protein n=1 Tax=Allacma fusca TaxID=39272 RepID=A0A8J2PZV7_9HEXA|nr:unnamed protein product [Allacma fusca]